MEVEKETEKDTEHRRVAVVLLWQMPLLVKHLFRCQLRTEEYDKRGHFVDEGMSALIHQFSDWVEYPRGNHTLKGHSRSLHCLCLSTDGLILFTSGDDRMIRSWDLTENQVKREWEAHWGSVYSLDFHPSSLVSGSCDYRIRIWDAHSSALIRTLEGHTSTVKHVSFAQDGSSIISCARDHTMREWDAQTGLCRRIFDEHPESVLCALPMADVILSGSEDKSVREWDVRTAQCIRRIEMDPSDQVWSLSLSCDARWLCCCTLKGPLIYPWPGMDRVLRKWYLTSTYSAVFHPRLPHLLFVGDNSSHSLSIFDIITGMRLHSFRGHSDRIRQLGFTPDDSRVISVAQDKEVRVWDLSFLS